MLSDLRRLEQVPANAARSAGGNVVLLLSTARRPHREVMLRAARSPQATLGQQLFAARHRAEPTVKEAATAARLPVDAVTAVEADNPVGADVTAAAQKLLARLSRR